MVRRYPVLYFIFLCAVFSCFRNPLNSDMDYGIFNMRTFLCVCIHMGVGHTDESAQHFDSEKLSHMFYCAPDGIQISGHGIPWISRLTLYQLRHTEFAGTTKLNIWLYKGDRDRPRVQCELTQRVEKGDGAESELTQRVEKGVDAQRELTQRVEKGDVAQRELTQRVEKGDGAQPELTQRWRKAMWAQRELTQRVEKGDVGSG